VLLEEGLKPTKGYVDAVYQALGEGIDPHDVLLFVSFQYVLITHVTKKTGPQVTSLIVH